MDNRYRDPYRLNRADSARFTRYGLTSDQYDTLLLTQGGTCLWCGDALGEQGKRGDDNPVVDHDHATGKVRGILHSGCNRRMGVIESGVPQLTSYLGMV